MNNLLRRTAATLVLSLGVATGAAAASATIDYTDLWYNNPPESQSGWGVNIIQQHNTMFVTLFVYGSDNTPRWYVASNVMSTGANTFSGALLYVGTGTWFGSPVWNPVTNVQTVGNIAFTFNSATTGTMVYTVNNVQVQKNIVRQTWTAENLTGNYIGGLVGQGSNCGATGILVHGELTVTHGATFRMETNFLNGAGQPGNCVYTGTYGQVGSQGQVTGGNYNCTINNQQNALVGTYTLSEIKLTRNGFNGRITGSDNACSYTGYFGGIKDVL